MRKLRISKFHKIIFILSWSYLISLVFFCSNPAISARCIPENACFMPPNPQPYWPVGLHECPCDPAVCEFGIDEYKCDDAVCNKLMSAQIVENPCTIFCMVAPIACQERIAGNLCSELFIYRRIHVHWLEVKDFGFTNGCNIYTCFNCSPPGVWPECGVPPRALCPF